MRSALALFALAATVLCSACGSNASDEKCAAACKAPASGPCAGADEAGCKASCTAMTSGLKTECVQCMIEHSGWAGIRCSCYGKPCGLCTFEGGGGSVCNVGSSSECTAAQETCSGFELYKASGSKCAAVCGIAAADSSTSTNPKKND